MIKESGIRVKNKAVPDRIFSFVNFLERKRLIGDEVEMAVCFLLETIVEKQVIHWC
jgi:hypothetical protein